MLLSGFSPFLMKFFLSGEMEEERTTLDEDDVKTRMDPPETLWRVMSPDSMM